MNILFENLALNGGVPALRLQSLNEDGTEYGSSSVDYNPEQFGQERYIENLLRSQGLDIGNYEQYLDTYDPTRERQERQASQLKVKGLMGETGQNIFKIYKESSNMASQQNLASSGSRTRETQSMVNQMMEKGTGAVGQEKLRSSEAVGKLRQDYLDRLTGQMEDIVSVSQSQPYYGPSDSPSGPWNWFWPTKNTGWFSSEWQNYNPYTDK